MLKASTAELDIQDLATRPNIPSEVAHEVPARASVPPKAEERRWHPMKEIMLTQKDDEADPFWRNLCEIGQSM